MPSIEQPPLPPCGVTGVTLARLLLEMLVVAVSLGVVNVPSVS